jgi:hypothetical protein
MTSRKRFSKELVAIGPAYNEKKLKVKFLQAELSVVASAFDDKVFAEVASVIVAFNNKLAADHLDAATHFDMKLFAELAAVFAAVDVNHAAELTSAFDGYEENMCSELCIFEDKLVAKIAENNKVFQEYKEKYQKLKEKYKNLKKSFKHNRGEVLETTDMTSGAFVVHLFLMRVDVRSWVKRIMLSNRLQ